MNHDEFERLTQSVFDRPGDARDRQRLEELAARAPELRERLDELEAARGALAGAGLEPLPGGLHEALLATARREPRRREERGSWLSFVTAAIQARPVHALGGAVAVGFAIGAIGIGLMMGGPRGVSDLAPGTTASLPPLPATVTTTVGLAEARVDLVARREAGAIVLHLVSHQVTPGELTLSWDPGSFRLSGARWQEAEASSFQPAPGRAVLSIPAAAGTELTFAEIGNEGGAVRARLSTAGGDREVTLRLPR